VTQKRRPQMTHRNLEAEAAAGPPWDDGIGVF